MASPLETLRRGSFFQGIRCPYELFASLYHLALPFESYIIDEGRNAEANPFGERIAQMDFDAGADSFNIDSALFDLAGMTRNEHQAALLVFELLKGLDAYLSGRGDSLRRPGRGTAISAHRMDRLNNPYYYHPTKVCVDGEEAFYTIIPAFDPLYSDWIDEDNKLPRDEAYFDTSLAAYCLNHHRLLRDGRAAGQKIIFPVNGTNDKDALAFLLSFEPGGKPLDKLSIALAPYDSGFKPELLTYEETEDGTVPFRHVRTRDPSLSEVKESLKAILTAAIDRDVDVLIFPELTVDHDAFTYIVNFLAERNTQGKLKLVVAGSYHRERAESGYVNMAPMLDWRGEMVWQHHKLQRYRMLSGEIAKSRRAEEIRTQFKARAGNDLEENIRTSHPLAFVDTPIGRMATVICLDYLIAKVSQAIGSVGCHYLWVPVMTSSMEMFRSHARDLYGAKHHVLSAFSASVSCCEMIDCKDKDLSYLYGPSKKFGKPGDPPGIVRVGNLPLIIYRLEIML